MKNFGSLMLAAVLGSVITIAATQWMGDKNEGVKIEHVSGVPISQVAYTKNEKGEMVPLDFTGTAEKVTKAVVHIRSTQTDAPRRGQPEIPEQFRQFFQFDPGQQGPSQSTGSGVIINKDGYIVTDNHVVDGADIVDVTLFDNRELKAEVIGTDPDTDLAVIKINEKDLPYLSFVNSDESKVGEWVLAVGNPFNLNSTVTAGIISAKGRALGIINRNNSNQDKLTAIESFIQTDAAINPGNSGGALVDLQGGLLGINTAIASNTGSYAGYGFAVPSNIVSKVVGDLLAYGTVQRGWLGIQVQSVDSDAAKRYDLAVKEGAYIADFSDPDRSAAKAAGLKKGDVVVKMDGIVIKSSASLTAYIGTKRPGDKVEVVVNREGKELNYTVTLKNREGNIGTVKREEKDAVASLGFELEDVDAKTLTQLDLKNGVRVKSVGNGKLARYTDMEEGFIITHINDQPVKSAKEINEIIKSKKPGDSLTFSGMYEGSPREYFYGLRI